MCDCEIKFLVEEIRGLLEGLERSARMMRFDLASDNIYRIDPELCIMKDRINYIAKKINASKPQKEDDEDEFI